ncbi:MAG: hypothetical protein IT340_23550 [Chloroflexi bacterium]|nr:hypothetical protein [Chloroflexota bacterium]
MAIERVTVGQMVRVSATFKVGAALTNPTLVMVTLKDPAGALTTPATTNDGTGLYHVDVTPAATGRHVVRFAGTGACVAAAEVEFNATSEVVG